jgi:hypothetical protein
MRTLTKILATTAVALAMTAATVTTASAGVYFITVAGSTSQTNNSFTYNGDLGSPGTGTLSTVGSAPGVAEHIDFSDDIYVDGAGQDAYLVFYATTDGPPGSHAAVDQGGGTYRQTGLNGYFQFVSAANTSLVLLRGDFTNAWLTGKNGTGSVMTVDAPDGSLTFSSDLPTLVNLNTISFPSAGFTFSGVHPGFGITSGNLNDFTATGVSGSFSGAVPEPASWGLMIMGFGAIGAAIRNRRRSVAVFA